MVFQVRDLGRSAGSMNTLEEQVAAPAELGVALIGVKEGSPVDLDLRFEAVHEGILVSGVAYVGVTGECGRCLGPIAYDLEADIQELFYYEGMEMPDEEEAEQHQVVDDHVDLESVLRDAVVTALPFQPVCREDCKGLCSECGISLNEDPDHQHEVLDPRWAALSGLAGTAANDAATRSDSVEREES
ncbi:YceD family protein [Arthrobacter sp. KK5.5]|uniref:YceD family protein n=1 Tax=Arthrobacter sp. KK5.5 TaxID=3373084 RepID=UPI003EE70A48